MIPSTSARLPQPKPEWAVLIYTSSTPDLEKATAAGLDEMIQGVDDGGVPVVVQWGKGGQAQRLVVDQGALAEAQALGPTDMSCLSTFEGFLEWGMSRYPAHRYAVVMGGHGAGFLGGVTDSDRRRMLRLPELRQALEAAPHKPELLVFNSCIMSCGETAAELKNVGGALVASQASEEGLGMPLGGWIAHLGQCADGAAGARALVDECRLTPERTSHISAIDLHKVTPFEATLDCLAQAILAQPQARPALQEGLRQVGGLWKQTWDFALYRQVDVGSLCQVWAADQRLPDSLREAARQAQERAQAMVLDKTAAQPPVGVSLFAPEKPWEQTPIFDKSLGQVYADLRQAQETHWDEAIHWLSGQDDYLVGR